MIIAETTALLRVAEKLEEQARKIRLSVAKIQKETKPANSQKVYSLIDEVNQYRRDAGLPQIVPLITDDP